MPPCITQLEGGLVQVAIEVEDRAQRSAITSTYFNIVPALYFFETTACNVYVKFVHGCTDSFMWNIVD